MDIQSPTSISTEKRTDTEQAARELGELLLHTPEYEAFLKTLNLVNNDPEVQRISAEMHTHQNALRWSPKDSGEHNAALVRLETELEALQIVQDYGLAEEAVCRMFAEVDAIISQAAGVPFAINAKRSGCGCGG
jgi:cell fate (sporulation/competence/biofilm development) regulator YlbF (YheA/YmcA/DUF963 family)